jgi:Organic solute transporter Ostalpha
VGRAPDSVVAGLVRAALPRLHPTTDQGRRCLVLSWRGHQHPKTLNPAPPRRGGTLNPKTLRPKPCTSQARLYLDPIRECYEAYVIYNFYMYLTAYLEDEFGDIDAYFSTQPAVEHFCGVQYLCPRWPMGWEFFWQCKKVRPAEDARQTGSKIRILHVKLCPVSYWALSGQCLQRGSGPSRERPVARVHPSAWSVHLGAWPMCPGDPKTRQLRSRWTDLFW